MLCLSIMQPWNWLILEGHKDFENRTTLWPCLRGQILLHAGKMPYPNFNGVCIEIQQKFGIRIPPLHELPLGALTGAVTIEGAVIVPRGRKPMSIWPSEWLSGPIGYKCDEPMKRSPMPYRGLQGPFQVPDEMAQRFLYKPLSDR